MQRDLAFFEQRMGRVAREAVTTQPGEDRLVRLASTRLSWPPSLRDLQKREEEAQKTAAEEFDEFGDDDETVEVKMDIDELVCGALESSFWAMDRLILRDKENYR